MARRRSGPSLRRRCHTFSTATVLAVAVWLGGGRASSAATLAPGGGRLSIERLSLLSRPSPPPVRAPAAVGDGRRRRRGRRRGRRAPRDARRRRSLWPGLVVVGCVDGSVHVGRAGAAALPVVHRRWHRAGVLSGARRPCSPATQHARRRSRSRRCTARAAVAAAAGARIRGVLLPGRRGLTLVPVRGPRRAARLSPRAARRHRRPPPAAGRRRYGRRRRPCLRRRRYGRRRRPCLRRRRPCSPPPPPRSRRAAAARSRAHGPMRGRARSTTRP